MPDSGQDHTADGNDGFLVATACFYAPIAGSESRIFFGLVKAFAICTKTGLR